MTVENWPNKHYSVIYADPPWKYRNLRTGGSMKSGASQKYPTMTTQEINSLKVSDIAEKNSVCFLWVTGPFLPNGFEALRSWGFNYKTTFVWMKRSGWGFWVRGQTEYLLMGIRGNVKAFRSSASNVIATPRLTHSEKPHEFRELIKTLTSGLTPSTAIELFARKQTPGWDSWGNELT